MKRRWPALLPLVLLSALGAQGGARVWEAPLTLPAYDLGPPDPNPVFPIWSQRRPVYPYPMLDDIGSKRGSRTFKAVYLENEFLKVTVLPELGGKLYSIYDKTDRRECLYTNRVVKYGLVGIRGAWTSGGIEWNFPDGHTVSTVSPVDYALRQEPGGAAAVVVGETERIQRMQWAVAIRLRPGVRAVETETILNNRNAAPGRYWYWATAAAPASDDLRFVYPMREAYPHAFWPVFSFPRHKDVDVGTYREVPNALSLFARGSRRDFFGVYYEKADHGIAHVADHRELAGKKTWTWGTDPSGRIWIDKLTDRDGQYVEFQAGRFETQMEHEFIAPRGVERFVEYWIPVRGLGGPFDEVSRDAALRFEIGDRRARLAMNVTRRIDGAKVTVERAGDVLYSKSAALSPASPFTALIDLDLRGKGQHFAVRVEDSGGGLILSWRSDAPIDGNPDFRPAPRPVPDPPVPQSAEQAWREGVAADKKSNEREARAAYRRSLERDPGFSSALIGLGWSFYRGGEYEEASRHLAAALRRNPDSAEAHYAMGLVERALGRERAAAGHLGFTLRAGLYETAARYQLGEMAVAAGRLDEARDLLLRLVQREPRDLEARTLLALADRLAGRKEDARDRVEAVLADMPIDPFALHERARLLRDVGNKEAADAAADELWRILGREPDSVLELVFDYAGAGRAEECADILKEALRRAAADRRAAHALHHYALGSVLERQGDGAGAAEQRRLGALVPSALVFPHRPEEVGILRAALAANPKDGRAAFYLGNALASLNRPAEALEAWRLAAPLDPSNPVLMRNLGLALWRVEEKKAEAVKVYSKAIAIEPGEHRRYAELDALLTSMGQTRERIRLLESAPAPVRARGGIVTALAAAYADAGRWTDALDLLGGTAIASGEGERGALQVYRRARLGRAREYRKQGKHEEAAAEFIRAAEFPPNLGVGRSSTESMAREFAVAAAEYEAAGRKDAALVLWQRAAAEPLGAPTLPQEPWSEHYYYKAVALERTGRKPEAAAIYERLAVLADDERMAALEPTPPRGALRFLLAGLGLKALGRKAAAEAALRKALELDPSGELAREALGKN